MTEQKIHYLKDYKQTPYKIQHTKLEFYLHSTNTKVVAITNIELREPANKLPDLILDGEDLKLLDIKIDNCQISKQDYAIDNSSLVIKNIHKSKFQLEITTEINPSQNTKLMGLYVSNNVFCTQCEAEGFRRITYFYDRPDVLSTYTVYIESDKDTNQHLLSNGNLLEKGETASGKNYAIWHDPFPKPCYLFALVSGNLDVITDRFTTKSGRNVALSIYTEKDKTSRAVYALDALKRSMRWDEEKFGREYDLDIFNIVAVSDFNMGAMENKGLNIFNDRFVLCDQNTATDADFAGVERVIAHEYFHNWTGNRITCRDWFQLCLKEGLTVFRDQEFRADERSRAVQRINSVRTLISSQFSVDKSPLSHPVRPEEYQEINNFYTTTIYEKGAELIRMLHTMLGSEIFRKAMDLYFERHDGQACIMEDYIKCFEDVSGKDLSQFMLWYSQSGTPHIDVTMEYDNGTLEIKLKQSLAKGQNKNIPAPMLIPLKYSLINSNGEIIKDDIFLLSEAEQTIVVSGLNEYPVLSIGQDLSAPVTITKNSKFSDTEENLFLSKYDPSAVNRWMAIQNLLKAEIENIIKSGKDYTPNKDILEVFNFIIKSDELDPSLIALYLTLPTETEIAQNYDNDRDPVAIYNARKTLMKRIADYNGEGFYNLLQKYSLSDKYDPSTKEAGKRNLYNTALLYYSIYKNDPTLLVEKYNKADNLTIRFATLSTLAHYFFENEQAQEVIQNFFDKYKDIPLVLDKWFAIQSTINRADAIDKIKILMKMPQFDINNPNRVYALLGSFIYGNQIEFNNPNGGGYDFISDIILQIDQHNPQLASRLLGGFGDWRKYDTARQEKAKMALEKIANSANISNDISDIVKRILS